MKVANQSGDMDFEYESIIEQETSCLPLYIIEPELRALEDWRGSYIEEPLRSAICYAVFCRFDELYIRNADVKELFAKGKRAEIVALARHWLTAFLAGKIDGVQIPQGFAMGHPVDGRYVPGAFYSKCYGPPRLRPDLQAYLDRFLKMAEDVKKVHL